MRFFPMLLVISLCLASARFLPHSPMSPEAGTSPATTPSQLFSAALDDMYNLEYEKARDLLEPWVSQHPADLAALNALAQTVLDQEMLREGLFSSSLYLSNGAGLRSLKRSFPSGFAKDLGGILDKAQAAAQDRLQRNPDDQEALYWGGVTHRIRAEFDLVVAHWYLAGFHEGRAAHRYETRLHGLNASYVDALFMIGLYDYAAGSLPWYAKPFAMIGGIHGSREQGLAELKQVSEQGQWDRIDAKAALVVFYRNEKKYSQALALLEDLRRSYPADFLAPLEIASIDENQGNWRAAADVLDDTVAKLRRLHTGSAETLFPQALDEDGRAHEKLGELEKSLSAYQEAANLTAPEHDAFIYRAGLAAAELCRRLNRPQEAQRDYQFVQRAAPDTDEGKAAQRALKSFH